MKVRIVEQHDGELIQKAEDVVRVVEKLSGRSLLKADPEPPAQFEYKSLDGAIERSRKHVDRIKALLDTKIATILEGA